MGLWCVLVGLIGCEPARQAEPVAFTRADIPVGEDPSAVLAADVTGDGVPDLIVATDRVSVRVGEGDGEFTPGPSSAAGANPVDLAAADFDEDGHLDLAVANHETRYLTLLLGDGTGRFAAAPGSPLTIDVSPHPHAVAATDVDGDGHVDLLVDHRAGEGFLLLRGRGDGRFEASGVIDIGGDPYRGLALADLDRDGQVDLVAPIERGVGIALGEGEGAFRRLPELRSGVRRPFAVTTADLNGDGIPDLGIGSGEDSDEVALLLGDGTGAFRPVAGSPFTAAPGATKMSAADLDGDGYEDVLVTSWDAPYLTILFGGPSGIRSQRVEVGRNPWAVATGDLDRDGDRDVVVGNAGDGTVTILLARPYDP